MSSHFTLAITSAMQSCRPVGPRRYQKPLCLVYTVGLCLMGWGSWARSQGSLQRLKWKVKLFGNIWRLNTHKRAVSSSHFWLKGSEGWELMGPGLKYLRCFGGRKVRHCPWGQPALTQCRRSSAGGSNGSVHPAPTRGKVSRWKSR